MSSVRASPRRAASPRSRPAEPRARSRSTSRKRSTKKSSNGNDSRSSSHKKHTISSSNKKKHHSRTRSTSRKRAASKAPADDEDLWAVHRILDKRVSDKGTVEYLTDWAPVRGRVFEPSWELEKNFVDRTSIEAFEQALYDREQLQQRDDERGQSRAQQKQQKQEQHKLDRERSTQQAEDEEDEQQESQLEPRASRRTSGAYSFGRKAVHAVEHVAQRALHRRSKDSHDDDEVHSDRNTQEHSAQQEKKQRSTPRSSTRLAVLVGSIYLLAAWSVLAVLTNFDGSTHTLLADSVKAAALPFAKGHKLAGAWWAEHPAHLLRVARLAAPVLFTLAHLTHSRAASASSSSSSFFSSFSLGRTVARTMHVLLLVGWLLPSCSFAGPATSWVGRGVSYFVPAILTVASALDAALLASLLLQAWLLGRSAKAGSRAGQRWQIGLLAAACALATGSVYADRLLWTGLFVAQGAPIVFSVARKFIPCL